MWNLPNALTLGRIAAVPVFVLLLLADTTAARWWALVVFVLASITDQLDGHLARSRNLVTAFGTLADPIADKALTLGAFVTLSALGEIPWWVTLLIAVRELGITVLRAVLARRSIIPASLGGKVKTALQMTAIIVLLVPWGTFVDATPMRVVGLVILYVALAVTVVTGLDYVRRGLVIARSRVAVP
ncbi:CDP-diacylglycerol--glycerol-3-phosphate 3-phosphatidyltransferase [Litorihabitans aurantiacus]|uniref:CDP-diacylglycerol--glycerol-3-phosphate 3-phosphatidyltransferase n=2 Tax=Litorihabitans aurantiacus TaxID=1930061 RepID=A0AA38CSS9_9MICO|nr:CDP-diacylglycerol--glycerol-3-phosphate 3-phosphatidyltransferase [Litorihabitans aurantiacus]